MGGDKNGHRSSEPPLFGRQPEMQMRIRKSEQSDLARKRSDHRRTAKGGYSSDHLDSSFSTDEEKN